MDTQSLHRIRSLAVGRRTAQVNQIRGLLLEYGIDIPQGRRNVRSRLPVILEDVENGLNPLFRELLSGLYEELVHLDKRIGQAFGLWTQHGISLHYGSLVGELGGTWFKIGTSFNAAAPDTGTLKLYYWDSNAESVSVSINDSVDIPESTTLALMGLGLAGIGYRRRRLAA